MICQHSMGHATNVSIIPHLHKLCCYTYYYLFIRATVPYHMVPNLGLDLRQQFSVVPNVRVRLRLFGDTRMRQDKFPDFKTEW